MEGSLRGTLVTATRLCGSSLVVSLCMASNGNGILPERAKPRGDSIVLLPVKRDLALRRVVDGGKAARRIQSWRCLFENLYLFLPWCGAQRGGEGSSEGRASSSLPLALRFHDQDTPKTAPKGPISAGPKPLDRLPPAPSRELMSAKHAEAQIITEIPSAEHSKHSSRNGDRQQSISFPFRRLVKLMN